MRLDPLPPRQFQSELPRDRSEEKSRLHHRKRIADADSRSSAEWQVCKTWERFRKIVLPSIGPELRRVREKPRSRRITHGRMKILVPFSIAKPPISQSASNRIVTTLPHLRLHSSCPTRTTMRTMTLSRRSMRARRSESTGTEPPPPMSRWLRPHRKHRLRQ